MFARKIRQIKILYLVALSLIALTLISSSVLVQMIARDNAGDARLINLAGRQRMLSQRMTKCVLALGHVSPQLQKPYLDELVTSLQSWRQAHAGLQNGDDRLGLPQQAKSPQLTALFASITPSYDVMAAAFEALVMKGQGHDGVDPDLIRSTADTILANEPTFLTIMDKITFQFDAEARQRVSSLRRIEGGILIVGLTLLAMEFLLVFRPSLRQLSAMMESLLTRSDQLRQEVDERRKIEQQLQEQQQELESRVAEEVRKNRDKDQVLMQNDKMASLGLVAAGVAHEINSPMGYVTGNLYTLGKYYEKIGQYDTFIRDHCLPEMAPSLSEAIRQKREELKVESILADGQDLISETSEGARRITEIVRNLKNFSRADAPERESVQVHACLESALLIAQGELKYLTSEIRKEYDDTPPVFCHPGQLNQVFLNLLINAGHAIAPAGEIVLKCWSDNDFVYASISDTGCGIPEGIRRHIFEPFFTTKEVGAGTGLGLSISHDIVKRHHGDLLLNSVVGVGTTFTVRLPRSLEGDCGELSMESAG